MAPLPPPLPPCPRVVLYHQTHHTPAGVPISVLPLLRAAEGAATPTPTASHVIVGAIHLNDDPSAPTLNDHAPDHARFDVLWAELATLQAAGVRVLGMLGGAAQGSYRRLDVGGDKAVSAAAFAAHYAPLEALVRRRHLDGLDLDIEEPMSLAGVEHLVDRLRSDFGPQFLITLAPVAAALLQPHEPRCNLSGFSYADLEARRRHAIAWYHAQFYCGWGDASRPDMYLAMTGGGTGRAAAPAPIPGLDSSRVVMGLVTNPANGPGFVGLDQCTDVLLQLQAAAAALGTVFGGVSGWEYFNALPGAQARPHEWAEWMAAILGTVVEAPAPAPAAVEVEADAQTHPKPGPQEADPDAAGPDVPVPTDFAYISETE